MKAFNLLKTNSILALFALLGIILQFGIIENRNLQDNDEWDYIFKIMYKCDESGEDERELISFSIDPAFWDKINPINPDSLNVIEKIEITYEDGEVITIDTKESFDTWSEKNKLQCKSPETYVDFKIKGNTTSLYYLFSFSNFNMIYAEKINPKLTDVGKMFMANVDIEYVFFKNLNIQLFNAESMLQQTNVKLVDLSNLKYKVPENKTSFNPNVFYRFLDIEGNFSLDVSSIDFKNDLDYSRFNNLNEMELSMISALFPKFYKDYNDNNPDKTPVISIKSKDNPNDLGEIYSANPNALYAGDNLLIPGGMINGTECPDEYPIKYDNRFCIERPYFFLPASEIEFKEGKNFSDYSRPCLNSKIEAENCGLCEETNLDKCAECKFGYTFENNGNCTFRGGQCYFEIDFEIDNCLYCQEENAAICSFCEEGFILNDDGLSCKEDPKKTKGNEKNYKTSFIIFLILFIICFICVIALAIIIYIKMNQTKNDIKYGTKVDTPNRIPQESVSEKNNAPSNNA